MLSPFNPMATSFVPQVGAIIQHLPVQAASSHDEVLGQAIAAALSGPRCSRRPPALFAGQPRRMSPQEWFDRRRCEGMNESQWQQSLEAYYTAYKDMLIQEMLRLPCFGGNLHLANREIECMKKRGQLVDLQVFPSMGRGNVSRASRDERATAGMQRLPSARHANRPQQKDAHPENIARKEPNTDVQGNRKNKENVAWGPSFSSPTIPVGQSFASHPARERVSNLQVPSALANLGMYRTGAWVSNFPAPQLLVDKSFEKFRPLHTLPQNKVSANEGGTARQQVHTVAAANQFRGYAVSPTAPLNGGPPNTSAKRAEESSPAGIFGSMFWTNGSPSSDSCGSGHYGPQTNRFNDTNLIPTRPVQRESLVLQPWSRWSNDASYRSNIDDKSALPNSHIMETVRDGAFGVIGDRRKGSTVERTKLQAVGKAHEPNRGLAHATSGSIGGSFRGTIASRLSRLDRRGILDVPKGSLDRQDPSPRL